MPTHPPAASLSSKLPDGFPRIFASCNCSLNQKCTYTAITYQPYRPDSITATCLSHRNDQSYRSLRLVVWSTCSSRNTVHSVHPTLSPKPQNPKHWVQGYCKGFGFLNLPKPQTSPNPKPEPRTPLKPSPKPPKTPKAAIFAKPPEPGFLGILRREPGPVSEGWALVKGRFRL